MPRNVRDSRCRCWEVRRQAWSSSGSTLPLSLTWLFSRQRHSWLLLSVGWAPPQWLYFMVPHRPASAVSQSWHGHSSGGQETGAGSMWYLVSVIFCNTYVLPVEMAEASIFVSHLIHLASPCCACLPGSRWSFVFWGPLSLRPYLCLTGQGIHNLLPLQCKWCAPPGTQHAASTGPPNKSVAVATQKIHE